MKILEAWEVCYTVMDNLHSVLVPSDEKDNLRKAIDTVNYSFSLWDQRVRMSNYIIIKNVVVTSVGINSEAIVVGDFNYGDEVYAVWYDREKDIWKEIT